MLFTAPLPATPRVRHLVALLMTALALGACSKTEEKSAGNGSTPYQMSASLPHAGSADGSGKFASGEEAYNKICTYCHDAGVGPVLKGRQLPPEMIVAIARSGMRAMPAFTASFIDDQTLLEVGKFIQQSPAPAAVPAKK